MLRHGFVFATFLAMVALGPHALRAEDTPTTLPGATVVTAEAAKRLVDQQSARVMDLRKKASFVEGHVPSASNVAKAYDDAANKFDLSILGGDKAVLVILYSHGPDGWKSYHAAKAAVEAGFTSVHWFRGGWMEWHQKGLPVAR